MTWTASVADEDSRLPNHKRPLPDADDVKQIVSADMLIGGDERKRYVLIGPKKDAGKQKDWLAVVAGSSRR